MNLQVLKFGRGFGHINFTYRTVRTFGFVFYNKKKFLPNPYFEKPKDTDSGSESQILSDPDPQS